MTQLRVHHPRPQQQPAEHVADAALFTELTAAELVLRTHRVPGLLRLVTELARRAFDCGRRHDTAIVTRALESAVEERLRRLPDLDRHSAVSISADFDSFPKRVTVALKGWDRIICTLDSYCDSNNSVIYSVNWE